MSNHSGALPPDAPMIMQAIRNEHPRPRPLYMLGEHWFKGYPGVGLLTNKIGLVAAHPANAQRLLRDEGRLVLVFPEGQKGSRKLFWQRYRLRRFGRGGFVRTAMRAGVPIVPIAVVGAEEAMPIFAHVPLLQRLTGLIYFPINHAFPQFGLAAALMYLPAKFKIRFLEPIDLSATRPRTPTTSPSSPSRSASGAHPGGAGRPPWRASRSGSVKLPAWGRGVRACAGMALAVGFWRGAAARTSRTRRARRSARAERRDPGRRGHRLAGEARRRPVAITISNQTHVAHSITLEGASTVDHAGPIPPGDTATIQKTLEPGSYEVKAGSAKAVKKEIRPAVLQIGQEPQNSNNDVLLP